MIFGLFENKSAQSPEQLGYDPNPATDYLINYLEDGSKFSTANEAFRDSLDETIGEDVGRNVVQGAFAPLMNRLGRAGEVGYLYDTARRAGAADNPNELRNFTSQYLAMTPAGQEQDMTPYYNNQSYYGPTIRREDGTYGGQDVFLGDEEKYAAADATVNAANKAAANYLAKLGAKGGFA
jgi:hypothetical protein